MPMMRKTITIPDAMEDWVKAQVESGRYANDSEYFRDLIRRDQDRLGAVSSLREMIDEGVASGVSDKSLDQVWQEAEAAHAKRKG